MGDKNKQGKLEVRTEHLADVPASEFNIGMGAALEGHVPGVEVHTTGEGSGRTVHVDRHSIVIGGGGEKKK